MMIKQLRAPLGALASIIALATISSAQTTASSPVSTDSSAEFRGVYASMYRESIFSPCDVPGVGSGWWLRFKNEGDAAFLRYPIRQYGTSTRTHFIRVRGRVSPPGHYGLGFQNREIVVDSVLEIKESMEPCLSYEDLPQPWEGARSSGSTILGAAVTDDRTLVAVLDVESVVSVWNAPRRTLVKQFPSEDKGQLAGAGNVPLAFTHDGKRLAMGGVDGVVRVWNPINGQPILELPAADTMPWMSGDGKKVIGRSENLTFNHSGTLLANTIPGRIAIWSMITGKRVDTFNENRWPSTFAFINDSSFVTNGDSGVMNIYPRLGGTPIWKAKTPLQSLGRIERTSDGRWLLLKGGGDTVYLWSLVDGQVAQKFALPYSTGTDAFALSPDGKTFAATGGTNGLFVWDVKTGQPIRSFQKFGPLVFKAWFTADGRSIVTHAWNDSVLRVVHLDPNRAPSQPVQAWWGANTWPLKLPPAGRVLGSIVGFVRDGAKKPVVGADVTIFDGSRRGSGPLAHTMTNAAGHYLLQNVRVPHVVVRVMMRGFAPDVGYAHLPTDVAQVDFELKADAKDR